MGYVKIVQGGKLKKFGVNTGSYFKPRVDDKIILMKIVLIKLIPFHWANFFLAILTHMSVFPDVKFIYQLGEKVTSLQFN